MIPEISLKKRIALELFRKYRSNAKKIHQLNYIFWECTLRCNLGCLHCGSDCRRESEVKDMPVDDFLRAIDDITPEVEPNKTMIVFTGGEPILRKDIEVCGRKLYERGFPWGIVSNGLLLNASRIQSLCRAGLRAVTISLDGLEATHNWLRANEMSFKRALEAVRILASLPDIRFDVVTCVHQRNFGELAQIKELLLSSGVKEWRLFTIFPVGRATRYPELQLNPVQFRQFFDFIASQRKEGGMRINYGCEGFLGEYEGEVRDNLFFCRAGVSVASVLADGSVAACPNLRGNFIQGNIYKDSFRDIWNTRYSQMRDRKWMQKGVCADCKMFRYCEGNGMHLHNERTGDLLFCHYNRLLEGS